MMYESPIKITYSEPEAIELASIAERIGQGVAAQQEEFIYGAIAKIGVTVDKDELLKALKYDRDQYEKGYAAGRASRDADIVRCKDCKYYVYGEDEEQYYCRQTGIGWEDDFYCAFGERRTDE